MSNSKISALTAATVPLAGTELLPVVQGGITEQVSVANLTAGRSVSMASATLSSGNLTFSSTAQRITGDFSTVATAVYFQTSTANSVTNIGVIPSGTGNLATFQAYNSSDPNNSSVISIGIGTSGTEAIISSFNRGTGTALPLRVNVGGVETVLISTAGDVTVYTGNIIQGTAAKGINFSANTPVAGKTSTLLNWYEEGTWTPNQGAGLTLVGAFSSTGRYTRIGRQVSISGTVTGATSVAVTAAGVITSNLPFTVGTAGHGNATNAAVTASAVVICTSTSVTSAAAIAATGTITFSATYSV